MTKRPCPEDFQDIKDPEGFFEFIPEYLQDFDGLPPRRKIRADITSKFFQKVSAYHRQKAATQRKNFQVFWTILSIQHVAQVYCATTTVDRKGSIILYIYGKTTLFIPKEYAEKADKLWNLLGQLTSRHDRITQAQLRKVYEELAKLSGDSPVHQLDHLVVILCLIFKIKNFININL